MRLITVGIPLSFLLSVRACPPGFLQFDTGFGLFIKPLEIIMDTFQTTLKTTLNALYEYGRYWLQMLDLALFRTAADFLEEQQKWDWEYDHYRQRSVVVRRRCDCCGQLYR
ncbi:MAG: hypothetical protein JNM52_01390 [Betaproteobacteria bacterium]|nr:hypothetical protein [Betaproteobacteria bacterium]